MSDWIAGTMIGTVVGNTVVRLNDKKRKGKKQHSVFLLPSVIPGGFGLMLTFR